MSDKTNRAICERAKNFFQICDEQGNVRLCGWARDGYIGKLTEHSIEELYCGKAAVCFRERHAQEDYSLCKVDACPYLAMGDIDKHKVSYSGKERLPESLYLGFERVCNYACRSCGVHRVMEKNKECNLLPNYEIIKQRIREVLPYIKHISANGCGELFACKHTLELLREWHPEAPKDECSVSLETNGSLFDEEHWHKIENLGEYYLHVSISVMSFNEDIYRYLSGTQLSIDKLINNLRYVRTLREQGVIDYLELATVVQEQNFREMPEFAKRCVEEFGADYVRLRPYEWWGECSIDEAWFKDIRNPYHPMYTDYKKVMSNKYILHPKVHDWSGGLDSEWASFPPSKIAEAKLRLVTEISLNGKEIVENIKKQINNTKLCIYGLSYAAKVLIKELGREGVHVSCIFDRNSSLEKYENITIKRVSKRMADEKTLVVISTMSDYSKIKNELERNGYMSVVHISHFLSDEKLKDLINEIRG